MSDLTAIDATSAKADAESGAQPSQIPETWQDGETILAERKFGAF